ncbi:beta-L-arabinofuranosidase domain-containing protein [Arthrobacter psychrochitiniphilus]|uniref:Non-reducing end beta-L-arabinofuranosidase-like GH127 catalytic domain-containing protein n=1 Tax=Arthrobacter psychrochitiniphilus TaxID=291045 RepID=A0A2V3DNL5_9MICC|nr:hypothetical protein CVS29_15885 [Arthrobacter psychrochitiniphilus]
MARRVADHIFKTFGPDGLQKSCGHAEIELGLMEFARSTANNKYRDQAQPFIERHGHRTLPDIELGRDYYHDDTPVRRYASAPCLWAMPCGPCTAPPR